MRIGIVFDLKVDYGIQNEDADYYDFCFLSEAEAAFNHLQLAGHDVFYIGNLSALLQRIKTDSLNCDIIYNIEEGYKSRNREGIVPSICEAFGIPYTGTDAFGLSLSLHKYQTGCFVAPYHILIPKSLLFTPGLDELGEVEEKVAQMCIDYPLLLKPNHEGSSMGLKLVEKSEQLKESILDLSRRFQQEILIQEYISGKELSTCILGSGNDAYVYSTVEYITLDGRDIDLFTKQVKINGNHKMIPARLDQHTLQVMNVQALYIHRLMGLKDISRIDWRYLPQKGQVYFIEATPLPELSEGTEFHWAAKSNHHPYSYVFSEIVRSAASRYGLA